MEKTHNSKLKSVLKEIATIVSWAFFVLLIIIAVFLVYYVVFANIYGKTGDEKYKPFFSLYTIISPSMEPGIKVYDVIVNLKVSDPKKIEVGDVITFTSTSSLNPGMTVTHRVIDIREQDGQLMFQTKGDNNKTPDGQWAPANNVLGKTVLKIPQLGRIQFFIGTKAGWVLVILCPALGIIIYDLLKYFKVFGNKSDKGKTNAKLVEKAPKEKSLPEKKNKEKRFEEEKIKEEKLEEARLEEKPKEISEEPLVDIDDLDEEAIVDNSEQIEEVVEEKPELEEDQIDVIEDIRDVEEDEEEPDEMDIDKEIEEALSKIYEMTEKIDKDKK